MTTNIQKKCAYCGAPATTRDHTPPRTLLRKPLPSHTITVPACEACNTGFSFNELLFKIVLAYASSHPDLIEAVSPTGSITQALARDANLRRIYADSLDEQGRVRLSGDMLDRIKEIIYKTVQGLYHATFARFVSKDDLDLVCFKSAGDFSLDRLVEYFRPPQVLDITNEPLPEITPNGWAQKGQAVVVTTKLVPVNGGQPIDVANVLWIKQETPVEWIPYQEGIFKFGFVGTQDKEAICAMELWETLIIGVSSPWPSGRGSLRKGRNNPFSRERRENPRRGLT